MKRTVYIVIEQGVILKAFGTPEEAEEFILKNGGGDIEECIFEFGGEE